MKLYHILPTVAMGLGVAFAIFHEGQISYKKLAIQHGCFLETKRQSTDSTDQ